MEALGAISEGVWSSLSGMYISEEADFMAKLLGKCSFPMELDGGSAFGLQPISWPSNESTLSLSAIGESSFYSLGITDSYSDMSNYNYQSENVVLSGNSSDHERYYFGDSSPFLATNSTSMSMDYCPNQDSSESTESLKETAPFQENYASRVEFESEMQQELSPRADENNVSSVHFKKRPRDIEDLPKTSEKNTKQKTVRRLDFCGNNDELDSQVACPNGSSSSPCNSEEDSNGGVTTCSSLTSKENVAVHPNGKMRASRGSATDPQSLYARKRRERINERLRILQNLVPNGTKVDISTMLEEAVHYVKFLQLQIKLLSSDELWMYAPLAYNGMDINLDLKTSRRR